MTAKDATITLEHVNVPPEQTWNYLKTNDVAFKVPIMGVGEGNLPKRLMQMETGVGRAASAWLDSAVYEPALISVPAHVAKEDPIVIDVDAQAGQVCNTGIVVHEGASATAVVIVGGDASQESPSGSMLRIMADKGARVTLYEYIAPSSEREHIEGVAIEADDAACVEVHQYFLGGRKVACGLAANMAGERSSINLTTRYFASAGELLDINHIVRMRGRNTKSNIDASGVLGDGAQKTLRATIDLVRGCKGAKGSENETVVVTGEDVVNKTLPVILCDEEDVQGDHGATIGSMSAPQLQYLQSRGLSQEDAEALFAQAIIDDAAMHAPTAAAKQAVLRRARALLSEEAAADLAQMLGHDAADDVEAAPADPVASPVPAAHAAEGDAQ